MIHSATSKRSHRRALGAATDPAHYTQLEVEQASAWLRECQERAVSLGYYVIEHERGAAYYGYHVLPAGEEPGAWGDCPTLVEVEEALTALEASDIAPPAARSSTTKPGLVVCTRCRVNPPVAEGLCGPCLTDHLAEPPVTARGRSDCQMPADAVPLRVTDWDYPAGITGRPRKRDARHYAKGPPPLPPRAHTRAHCETLDIRGAAATPKQEGSTNA
jgi:hypothetical protein